MDYITCPKDNGGCGYYNDWMVSIDRDHHRIVLDCAACGSYRISLPLDVARLTLVYTGPIEITKVDHVKQSNRIA